MSIIYHDGGGLIALITDATDGADVVLVHPYDHALQAVGPCTPGYGRPLGHWLNVSGPQR